MKQLEETVEVLEKKSFRLTKMEIRNLFNLLKGKKKCDQTKTKEKDLDCKGKWETKEDLTYKL